MTNRDKLTTATVNLGLFTNILLSIAKISIGILGHSAAVLADGVNSSSDVVYYIAVKIFMHHARKPADEEHPYGHRQLESISAIVVGAFILTTGIAIFWESINKVYDLITHYQQGVTASIFALIIALVTFAMKIFLYMYTRRNAKLTMNPTLRALANDHLNDIMASVAVIVGVVMGRMGYHWMDPAAGAIVAIYIIKTGVGIVMDSSRELMDSVPDEEFAKGLRIEAMRVEGVLRVDELGMHRFGPYYTVDMTIAVDGGISVNAGHVISHAVENHLLEVYSSGLRNVYIHYHPLDSKASNRIESKIKPTPRET